MVVTLSPLFPPSSYSVCERGRFNCTQEQCEEVNHCPGSLVYSPRSCLLTCSSLDPPGQQRGPDVAQSGCREPMSGCVCPQGTVLLVGESLFLHSESVVYDPPSELCQRSHGFNQPELDEGNCEV